MASSSTTWQWKYSVFLSFNGEDLRHNFISFLYEALSKVSGDVFIDYRLKPAEEIAPALEKAIEGSRIAVIVFSKNYASSTWCLDELEKIIQWNESHGQIVIPVFYDVDSSHVHNPSSGIYAEAFDRHEWKLKGKRLRTTISKAYALVSSLLRRAQEEERLDKVERWKSAMIKAASFKGWDSNVTRPDTTLVNAIVKHILTILIKESPNNTEGLVGIDSRIQHIKELLSLKSDDVRLLSIVGMGGIGKTTIATVLFKQICSEFDASCILLNIRQEVKMCGGIIHLKRKLYSGVLGEEIMVQNIEYTSLFQKRKVLIILDDLTDLEQLIFLIGDKSWLGSGSRIVITCRERGVFERSRILGDGVVVMNPYEVEPLNYTDALNLFCKSAFIDMPHSADEFWSLSNSFVEYASGVPLALVILGRHLQTSYGNIKDWENALANLKNGPRQEIQDVLKLSYDGLSDDGKKMFLDVACFFNGENFTIVRQVFKVCKYSEDINYLIIKGLIAKSTSESIVMHHLLEEMGRKIERESNSRKRIWEHDDAGKLFRRKEVWKNIESISLDMSQTVELKLPVDFFARTPNLKHLKFYYSNMNDELKKIFKVRLPQGLECFSEELVYLYWPGYPLESFPPNFDTTKLVALDLRYSELRWEKNKELETSSLVKFPSSPFGFSLGDETFRNIGKFKSVVVLNLCGSKNISRIPSATALKFLEVLQLADCPLVEFPDVPTNIRELYLDGTPIDELPPSIQSLHKLQILTLSGCPNLTEVPLNILFCNSLGLLYLNHSNVESFTNSEITDCLSYNEEHTSSITSLDFSYLMFESFPFRISQFCCLVYLELNGCKYLRSLPVLPPSLQVLTADDCSELENICSLQQCLDLRPRSLGNHIFRFGDCLKVNEISWRNLQPSIILLLHDIAFDAKYFPRELGPGLQICYPGTSIPESFASSNDTASITINLLPNWNNSSFLGFVLCAVVDPITDDGIVDCNCRFAKGNGDSIDIKCRPFGSNGALNSQHVTLWYDSCLCDEIDERKEWFSEECNKVSFEFSEANCGGESKWIKKCGVYPLYKKLDSYYDDGFNKGEYERVNSMFISNRQRWESLFFSNYFSYSELEL